MSDPVFRSAGSGALLADFGSVIEEALFGRVLSLDRALATARPYWLQETVPAYTSLLIVFDPLAVDHGEVMAYVRALEPTPVNLLTTTTHVVPVCYEGEAAPDISEVAATLGTSEEAVIAAHLAGDYRVFMYGFAPGYAYLGGVPNELRLPRKVAAVRGHAVGSVMVAGPQCLITTLPMPTGWWVIGRTPLRVLDPASERPFLFEAGDRVRFTRVGLAALQ
ncbi:allophanate hydrolase subunit 1 [Sphingomonas sp. IC-11]|uniref:5-oxoprolinase subunit B family protein n=1 Tax=Sphingomonas sp. IC-11 TaxID=2898528 RepID=UPI001E41C6AF|nr:allophanate hydrolase subunit 1 [Sphingomonas sp. IC-11]MCD2315520.1 allophanate hydrolase subunit 1 [Sphingomonas sp. IC-11]